VFALTLDKTRQSSSQASQYSVSFQTALKSCSILALGAVRESACHTKCLYLTSHLYEYFCALVMFIVLCSQESRLVTGAECIIDKDLDSKSILFTFVINDEPR